MSNTYRALTVQAEGVFAPGVFEHEFTPAEERDWLGSGLVEIVPRTYRVLSTNLAAGEQGELVELALLVEHEAVLIAGGHIERVDDPSPKKSATKKAG